MAIDFGKLGGGNVADEAAEPRKIFAALPDKKHSYPRDVQTDVWEKWYAQRNSKDVVLKMNTGSGKTVVGLFILKSCLNEKVLPAVYFTPDKYLAEQVAKEAAQMKIPVTMDEHSAEFLSGKAILVTNIHKLFNGKSVFGVGSEGTKIPIGAMVIDDAHACISVIKDKFALRINSTHAAYTRIWSLISNALREQSSSKVLDLENYDPVAFMRVPFWTWQKEYEVITKILHDYRDDIEVKFVWPLIKEIIQYCTCIVGAGVIEISPNFAPVDMIPSFKSAQRRIYMSATISDETILVSDLQADQKSIENVVVPKSIDDLGERMILFPQQINPQISDDDLKNFFKHISQYCNTVILVPSKARTSFWAPVADLILDGDNISQAVEALKTKRVGLVVLVNRYDGIDLPDDAARVLVIDGVPLAQSHREKVENSILNQSDYYLERKVNKIEQGMGRGTRSNSDYCAVFLMNHNLASLLYSPKAKQKFSPATLAQLNLAEKLADQLKGQPLTAIFDVMSMCLGRKPEWVSAAKSALSSVVPNTNAVFNHTILALAKANELCTIGQYKQAVGVLLKASNDEGDNTVKGYLLQNAAEIMNFYDQAEAQQTLLAGLSKNRNILKPIKGINYSKINSAPGMQEANAVEFAKSMFIEPNECLIQLNSVLSDLKFAEDTFKSFESAFEYLGKLLGFEAQRPDNEYGVGPDVLWGVGGLRYFVIECKNGVKIDNKVTKYHSGQLSTAQHWFTETYDKSCSSTAMMIHPSIELEASAFVSDEMRVMDVLKLNELKTAIKSCFEGLCHTGAIYDPNSVMKAFANYGLTADQFVNRYTRPFKK